MNRVRDVLFALLGSSLAVPFFSSLVLQAPLPHVIDIAFGFFPFVALSFVLSFAAFLVFARERESQAIMSAFRVTSWACAGAFILSIANAWNDGSFYAVLTPSSAFASILTLGILPFRMGPDALVRFLPVFVMGGMLFRLRRSSLALPKRIAISVVAFLILSIVVHSLSWTSGFLAMSKGETLANPADAYKTLVSAQADGYWTRVQGDRFFAPIGTQSENSFSGIQAGFAYLLAAALLFLLAFRSGRSAFRLAKRLTSRSVAFMALAALIGYAVGLHVRGPIRSYTDILALLMSLVVTVCWLSWWRLARDIGTIARDEKDREESMRDIFLILSLVGAFFLGWFVFLPLCCITLVASALPSWNVSNVRSRIVSDAIGAAAMAGGFVLSVLSVMLRDAAIPSWLLHFVLALALLLGLERLLRRFHEILPSRLLQAVGTGLGITAALFLANQRAFWLLFLPMLAGTLVIARNDASWRRFRHVPLYFVIVGFACIAVFLPQWLVQG